MQTKQAKVLAAAVAVAMSSGCMGSFALTKGVYNFNDTITGNKIVNNIIFWGLAILPVYELALFGDLVILNTIEFWTGAKLFGDAGQGDSGQRVVVNEHTDGSLTLTGGDRVVELVPAGDNRVVVVVDGVVVGSAMRQADGSVVASRADGDVVIAANDVAARQHQVAAALQVTVR
jgi:hypothetical protein